ncbi:MAG: toll/interleukin-1 receptor domain-containing protein [Anaerolineales bacterium]
MSLSFYRRKFQIFISSINSNREVVESIKHWLTDKAGITILDGLPQFLPDDSFENRLENALELCQSLIICITKQRVESGQVKREFELGLKQQNATEGLFRIIPIRLEDCVIPDFLHLSALIDITENGFDMIAASKLMLGFYFNGVASEEGRSHDVFISRPWSVEENGLTSLVCKSLKRLGFRLIGNMVEQPVNADSLKRLVSSCGGGVAVIPRGVSEKTAKKITNELEVMSNFGLPFIIISDSSIKLPHNVASAALSVLRLDATPIDIEKQVYNTALVLQEEWVNPPEYQYIFYGTDLKAEHKVRNRLLQKVVRHITTLSCLMGEDIQRGQIQSEIIGLIVRAQMMIADISQENLNTCIEAGVAIGANVPLNLLSGDERHKPPFMFRDRQVWHYQSDLDLLGTIHKFVIPYRRYIL